MIILDVHAWLLVHPFLRTPLYSPLSFPVQYSSRLPHLYRNKWEILDPTRRTNGSSGRIGNGRYLISRAETNLQESTGFLFIVHRL